MKKEKLFFVALMLLTVVTIPFFFFHGESEVKAEGESFEGETNTYVAYWPSAENPNKIFFDSRLTNGKKVRDSRPVDVFWHEKTEIIDAGYIKIPDYITSVDQIEFELVFKPAHVEDPQSVMNQDGTFGLQIINNYMGTGERMLRIPVVSTPATAKVSSVIFPYGDGYRYDSKIVYRINFKVEEEPEEPLPPNGQVEGKVFWELRRPNQHEESRVFVESDFKITATHYATRNIKHTVNFNGKQTQNSGQPIKLDADGRAVKGTSLKYTFSYEYTNYPIGWVCGLNDCWWDSSPDWSRGKTLLISDSLPIDHKQGETVKGNMIEDLLRGNYSVGKEDVWHYPSKKRNLYFEEWRKSPSNQVKSHYELLSQFTLPITPGQLIYQVSLPSKEHEKWDFQPLKIERSAGFYFPADIDDSLKEEYSNNTKYTGFNYAFPLQQSVMQDKGTTGGKRTFEWEYITDMFFMSDATGFVIGTPYAERVKDSLVKNIPIPAYETLMEEGRNKVAEEFTKTTGQTFVDYVLDTGNQDFHKLQLYAIPVSADSPLRPNETYKNHIVLENMGLSDLIFEFDQSFLFEHYLFGSAADDALIVAQRDSRVPITAGADVHRIVLKHEEHVLPIDKLNKERTTYRMHKFRRSDRDFTQKVREIIGEDVWDELMKDIVRAEPR